MNVLRPVPYEYYGDDNRWFLGYVINAVAPAGLEGRVKVRIIGVHNPDVGEIPERDLPWAQVITPTTEGGAFLMAKHHNYRWYWVHYHTLSCHRAYRQNVVACILRTSTSMPRIEYRML